MADVIAGSLALHAWRYMGDTWGIVNDEAAVDGSALHGRDSTIDDLASYGSWPIDDD